MFVILSGARAPLRISTPVGSLHGKSEILRYAHDDMPMRKKEFTMNTVQSTNHTRIL